jgi:VanZ family protein
MSVSLFTWPRRRVFGLGLAAALLFALYGSLLPFEPRSISFAQAVREFIALWSTEPMVVSRADLVANVLVGVPIGFFLMGFLNQGRPGIVRGLTFTALTLVLGGAFACVLEFLQSFFPGRVVATADVLAQIAGSSVGILAWFSFGPAIDSGVKALRESRSLHVRDGMLTAYSAVWIFMALLPLDLTIRPAELFAKYRRGDVVLIPFTGPYASSGMDMVWDGLAGFLAAIPIGLLMVRVVGRTRMAIPAAFALGAACVATVELAQLFVATRIADVTDILTGFAGVAIGVALATRRAPAHIQRGHFRNLGSALSAWGLCSLWTTVLLFYHWKPFAFQWSPAVVRSRLDGISLVPFSQSQNAPAVQVLADVLLKFGLAVPLGFLLARAASSVLPAGPWVERIELALCGVAALLIFGALEAGQLFLPARFPDVTDVLVGTVGALSGTLVALRFDTRRPLRLPGSGTGKAGSLSGRQPHGA